MKTAIRLNGISKEIFSESSIIEIVKHLSEIGKTIGKDHLKSHLMLFFINFEDAYRVGLEDKMNSAIVALFEKASLNDYMNYLQYGIMGHYGVPFGEEDKAVNSLSVADRLLDHNRILSFIINVYLYYIETDKAGINKEIKVAPCETN